MFERTVISNLSIKQKIILTLTLFVVLTAVLISSLNVVVAKKDVHNRVMNSEIPAIVNNIASHIDSEIQNMLTLAKELALDEYATEWLKQGAPKSNEQTLINKLKRIQRTHNLSTASFANRKTADYWNQRGFLRKLQNDQSDGWFYRYRSSGNAKSISVYQEQNGDVDLFVNYQNLNGLGLAGASKSFNDVVKMLAQYKIEQTGFVYLVDENGTTKLHKNKQLANDSSLASLYNKDVSQKLLQKNAFNIVIHEKNGESYIVASSSIPSVGWYAVAEVPYEDMFVSLDSAKHQTILWTVAVTIISIIVAWFVAGTISRPIQNIGQVFSQLGQGNADLSYRMTEQGQPEAVTIAEGYNQFISKLNDMFNQVTSSGEQLREVSNNLNQYADITLQSVKLSDANTAHISSTLNEVNITVNDIAQSASEAAGIANSLENNRSEISQVIESSTTEIKALTNKFGDIANVIRSLANNSETIASVLSNIEAISEQTNLLALNAAIEAARAGEQGRGFAVVADEVRTLAKRTADSTQEIQIIMDELKKTSASATAEISEIIDQSTQTAESISQADDILQNNRIHFEQISDMNRLIATATEEQSVSIDDINQNMADIKNNSQANIENVQKTLEQILSLNQLAEQLDLLLKKFQA